MPLSSRILVSAALIAALAGCAHLGNANPSPLPANPLFASDLAAHDGFVIGELHGTAEAPAAFANMVASLPERSLVALELRAEVENLGCPNGNLPAAWTAPGQDGRSSAAIHSMVCALKTLEADGRITILYVDDRSRESPQYYETAAARITAAMASGRYAHFFAYTGNFHSSNQPGHLPDILRQNGLDTLAVTTSHPEGTAWNCIPGEEGIDCGEHESRGSFCEAESQTGAGWQTYGHSSDRWDRCLTLPSMTASPPSHDN